MKKSIKTIEIEAAYKVLNGAKTNGMKDEDKIAIWKIARVLKPIATKFEEDTKDAAERLKPEDKDFDEKVQKFYEYNAMIMNPKANQEKLPMGPAEYRQFAQQVFAPYNELVKKATKEIAEAIVEVKFEPLSEETFTELWKCNEKWEMEQVTVLGEVITA